MLLKKKKRGLVVPQVMVADGLLYLAVIILLIVMGAVMFTAKSVPVALEAENIATSLDQYDFVVLLKTPVVVNEKSLDLADLIIQNAKDSGSPTGPYDKDIEKALVTFLKETYPKIKDRDPFPARLSLLYIKNNQRYRAVHFPKEGFCPSQKDPLTVSLPLTSSYNDYVVINYRNCFEYRFTKPDMLET